MELESNRKEIGKGRKRERGGRRRRGNWEGEKTSLYLFQGFENNKILPMRRTVDSGQAAAAGCLVAFFF